MPSFFFNIFIKVISKKIPIIQLLSLLKFNYFCGYDC